MKPEDFLKLIGAPWRDTGLAFIRSTNDETAVASIYGGYGGVYSDSSDDAALAARCALFVAAPELYRYVAARAAEGDTEAKMILREVHRDE